jgi:hypothetical protein
MPAERRREQRPLHHDQVHTWRREQRPEHHDKVLFEWKAGADNNWAKAYIHNGWAKIQMNFC